MSSYIKLKHIKTHYNSQTNIYMKKLIFKNILALRKYIMKKSNLTFYKIKMKPQNKNTNRNNRSKI